MPGVMQAAKDGIRESLPGRLLGAAQEIAEGDVQLAKDWWYGNIPRNPIAMYGNLLSRRIDALKKVAVGAVEDVKEVVQTKVQEVQDTVNPFAPQLNEIEAKVQNVLPAEDMAAEVWNSQILTGGHINDARELLAAAGMMAQSLQNSGMLRSDNAPRFLISGAFATQAVSQPGPDLLDVDVEPRLAGETTVAYLNRIHPEITWSNNYGGGPYVGGSYLDPNYGNLIFQYVPEPPSLAEIRELMRYETSSGEMRDGWTDLIFLLSTVPVRWDLM